VGPSAHAIPRLEDHDVDAGVEQDTPRRKAGEAGAHHDDIDIDRGDVVHGASRC
jgi:hypothetical protein